MTIYYGIAFFLALLLFGYCLRAERTKNSWLRLLFASVTLCNAGYLALSLARTLPAALAANTVAYLGSVFLPFLILMMILRLSRITVSRRTVTLMCIGNLLMFLIAASGGILPIYYREVRLEVVDGAARLIKVYGPLHGFYKVFLLAYFTAMIGIIVHTAVRKTAVSTKHTTFLAIVVGGNIALWLVENLTGVPFEFLSISYIMTECLILLLYAILQDYENAPPAQTSEEMAYSDSDLSEAQPADRPLPGALTEAQIRTVLASWKQVESLSQREKEVLGFILQRRRRKDIAAVLFITESTVKKHTTNIYRKLGVENRSELFQKAVEFEAAGKESE